MQPLRTRPRVSTLAAFALAVPVLAALYADVSADVQRFGVGPRFGAYTAVDADGVEQSGGAAVRFRMFRFLGIEGSMDYAEEAFGDGLVTARCWPVMVTGVLYPLPMIYAAYGVDWNHMSFEYAPGVDRRGADESRQVAWHAGAGLEIPLGAAASLVGEFRYVFVDYRFDGMTELEGTNTNSYLVTVGVLISLLPPESATEE